MMDCTLLQPTNRSWRAPVACLTLWLGCACLLPAKFVSQGFAETTSSTTPASATNPKSNDTAPALTQPLSAKEHPDRPISFATDIQPLLTRLGCNQGACHGAQLGKGGFKLSLRGFDDASDYQEIAKGSEGRRLLLADPAASLLLTKPTLVVPHQGGHRLELDSEAWWTICRWIEQGARGPSASDRTLKQIQLEPAEVVAPIGKQFTLRVQAHYSDNTLEDVAHKATFDSLNSSVAEIDQAGNVTVRSQGETALMVRYLGQVAVARILSPFHQQDQVHPALAEFADEHPVDRLWKQKWQKLGLVPTTICNDATFLRRLMLDLIGTLPTVAEIEEFNADTDPNKRMKWVERILSRQEYTEFWAHKWGDLLRVDRQQLTEKGM